MPISDSAKSNLAIVLITGSHTSPSFWGAIVPLLNNLDYPTVIAVPNLSACPAKDQRWPPAKLADDAFYIHEVLQALIHKGKDIVLVMASYGGLPGTEALRGLPSRGRLNTNPSQAGQTGAIVGLVYLSAILPFVGDSCVSALDQPVPEAGTYGSIPDGIGPDLFCDWDPVERGDKIKYWMSQIITQSADALTTPLTYDLWGGGEFDGKVAYIIGERDQSIKPVVAEKMISRAEDIWGKKITLRRFDGGHVMMITMPNEMVGVVEELIESLIQS